MVSAATLRAASAAMTSIDETADRLLRAILVGRRTKIMAKIVKVIEIMSETPTS